MKDISLGFYSIFTEEKKIKIWWFHLVRHTCSVTNTILTINLMALPLKD